MTLASVTRIRLAGLVGLVGLGAVACGGGRDFQTPKTLAEYRPTRRTTTPAATDDAAEAFRATPPARTPSRAAQAPVLPTEVRLSNGIRVVMLERHDFPSISAVLVLDHGAASAGPGVAQLYSEAMLGSSNEYKSTEAWQYLGFVGGVVNNETWFDAIGLQITALSPLFVSAMSRAAPMFTAPSLDGDDLDEARTHLAAEHASADEDPADVARDALYAAVFPPPHPYGTPIAGQPARLGARKRGDRKEAAVTDAAVKGFRASNLGADHVGVAVVGDFKPASIQRILENALGKLPKAAPSAPPTFPTIAPGTGRKVIVIDRPGAAQSSVAIGWPGPRASEADLVTLDVLAGATAGDLSTRLNITVRKELGASYGVHMSAVGLRSGGIVTIGAAIDTARTVDALRGLFKEIDRLRTEPLSPAELGAAKLRTYHELERGSTRGLARYLARAIAEDLPPASVVTHNARVDVVTAEAVRAAAAHYLAAEDARVVIVGDASTIVAGLKTLGIGDVSIAAPH
ncbi:MAG: zinc protease [Myxococcales bacterium]|nr:zinc protease [Myxococcales bacterium]